MFSLEFQINTKRYVFRAFLSRFVDGAFTARTLARWYPLPPMWPYYCICVLALVRGTYEVQRMTTVLRVYRKNLQTQK